MYETKDIESLAFEQIKSITLKCRAKQIINAQEQRRLINAERIKHLINRVFERC